MSIVITNFTGGISRKTAFAMNVARNLSSFDSANIGTAFKTSISVGIRNEAKRRLRKYMNNYMNMEEADERYMASEAVLLSKMHDLKEGIKDMAEKERLEKFYDVMAGIIDAKPNADFFSDSDFYQRYLPEKTAHLLGYLYPEAFLNEKKAFEITSRWFVKNYGIENAEALAEVYFRDGREGIYSYLKEKGIMNPTNANEIRSRTALLVKSFSSVMKIAGKELIEPQVNEFLIREKEKAAELMYALSRVAEDLDADDYETFRSVLRKTLVYAEKAITPVFSDDEKEFMRNYAIEETFAKHFSGEPEYSMSEESGDVLEIKDENGDTRFLRVFPKSETVYLDLSSYPKLKGVEIKNGDIEVDENGFPKKPHAKPRVVLKDKGQERPVDLKIVGDGSVSYEGVPDNIGSVKVRGVAERLEFVTSFPAYEIAGRVFGDIERVALRADARKLKNGDFAMASRYFVAGDEERAIETFDVLTAHLAKFAGHGYVEKLRESIRHYARAYEVLKKDIENFDEDALEAHLQEQVAIFSPDNVFPDTVVNASLKGMTFSNVDDGHATMLLLLGGRKRPGSDIDGKIPATKGYSPAFPIETDVAGKNKKELFKEIRNRSVFAGKTRISIYAAQSKFNMGIIEAYDGKNITISPVRAVEMCEAIMDEVRRSIENVGMVPLRYAVSESGTLGKIMEEVATHLRKTLENMDSYDEKYKKKVKRLIDELESGMSAIASEEDAEIEGEIIPSIKRAVEKAEMTFLESPLREAGDDISNSPGEPS